jgi:hypothetical protein
MTMFCPVLHPYKWVTIWKQNVCFDMLKMAFLPFGNKRQPKTTVLISIRLLYFALKWFFEVGLQR